MPRGYTRYLQSRNRRQNIRNPYFSLSTVRRNSPQLSVARRYRRVVRSIPAAAQIRRYTRINGRYVPHIWRRIYGYL